MNPANPQKLVVASNNPGKLRELEALLAPLGFALLPQGALNIPEAEEPHATFLENALAKARHASAHAGLPAIADDSGICVAALGGEPGIHSARYAGEPKSDARNNQKLLAALDGQTHRAAHYVCVLVYLRRPDDPQPVVAEGEWHGTLLEAPRGHGGFGYDPLFYLPDHGQSAGELDAVVKNRVSHRAQAMRILVERLRLADR